MTYTLIGIEDFDFYRWLYIVCAVVGVIWAFIPMSRWLSIGIVVGALANLTFRPLVGTATNIFYVSILPGYIQQSIIRSQNDRPAVRVRKITTYVLTWIVLPIMFSFSQTHKEIQLSNDGLTATTSSLTCKKFLKKLTHSA